jgi:hypothetical protein
MGPGQAMPPQAPGETQPQESAGGATQAVISIQDGYDKLVSLISKGLPDVMPTAQRAVAAFNDLVEELGTPAGQSPKGNEPPAAKGAAPMEAGARNVEQVV